MVNGFTHENISGDFDGVTFVNRAVANLNDGSITITDDRMARHPWFTLNVTIWPSASDAFTNRPYLTFNGDTGAHYETSFRAFLNTSASPPSTEAPSIEHLSAQNQMYLVPNNAVFQLTGVDIVFCARIDVMQLDQTEDYRVFSHWSVGQSSASVNCRHGFMVGNYSGGGSNGIKTATVNLGASGKMGAGAYLEGYSMQSSMLGGGYVYKNAELPTGKVWVDGRVMYRYTLTGLSLPASNASTTTALPITTSDVATSRLVDFWAYRTSPSNESRRPHDLQAKLTTTQLILTSPSGGTDWSSYTGVGVWEYAKTS